MGAVMGFSKVLARENVDTIDKNNKSNNCKCVVHPRK